MPHDEKKLFVYTFTRHMHARRQPARWRFEPWLKLESVAIATIRCLLHNRSLPCDSHPQLCKHCKALRAVIACGRLPNHIYINTRRGLYYVALKKTGLRR